MTSLLTTPIPHDEGAAFVINKPALTRAVFDALAPDLQARSFVITGVECLDAVARVRELTAQLPQGGDYDELKSQILGELSPWLITASDPEEAALQAAAASRRAEMLLRMHGWQAYAQTQDALMRANEDAFPYRMYLSSEDSRVRPSHAALNKRILPADHPFWLNHTPPWEFGCRCDCVPMTQEEVDEIAFGEQQEARPLEDRQVLGPEMLREIEENQRLVKPGGTGFLDLRTPREKSSDGSGYEFRPADNALDIDQILQRFTPLERSAFEAFAQNQRLEDGRTLLDWWQNAPASPRVPALPAAPSSPAAIASPRTISAGPLGPPVSAALDIRMRAKAIPTQALAAIDSVHGDGTLPTIRLDGSTGSDHLGVFESLGRAAVRIGVKASGTWPRLTTAHEVGHFLDFSGMGTVGRFSSDIGEMATVINAIRATPTVQSIPIYQTYYLKNHELWARAYAQFIATESADPVMREELARILTSHAPWRQWPDEEFAPISAAIRSLFTSLKWITP